MSLGLSAPSLKIIIGDPWSWGRAFACIFVLVLFSLSPAFAATTVSFTINMSEAVTVTGTPRISVDVGGNPDGNARSATYAAGSGTSALTFNYAMIAGDVDLDGVSISSPIDLNGGQITDLNGNNISDLTFTLPNTSNVRVNYPSLGMDFTTDRYTLGGTVHNSLTSFLSATGGTFTRGSTATYFNSSGILTSAASGVARFNYNPATLAAKGVLLEEARTNFFRNSSALPSSTNNAPTLTSDIATAPDGTLTADRVATTVSASGIYGTVGNAALSAGTQYTISCFLKRESGVNTVNFGVPNTFTNNAGDWLTVFNFSTNSFSSTNGNLSNVGYRDIGNGWVRLFATATVAAGGTGGGPLVYSNGGGINFLMWGTQIEQGAFVTSYIPTSGATATRAVDSLIIPTGGWYNTTEGTLQSSAYLDVVTGTQRPVFSSLDNGTLSNRMQMNVDNPGGSHPNLRIVSSGTGITGTNGPSTLTVPGNTSLAGAFKSGSTALYMNGVQQVTLGTAYTLPAVTQLNIGNGAGFAIVNGNISKVRYYPVRISNTQLQLLTQ